MIRRFVENIVMVTLALGGAALLILPITTVTAIVTSGNANDAKWLVEYDEAPFFVSLFERGDCAGTIISKRHVVTAAHCLCGTDSEGPKTILADGSDVKPVRAFRNPDCKFSCSNDGPNKCDAAVLEYDADLTDDDSVPLGVYEGDDEVGMIITIYGCGLSGDAGDLTSALKCRRATEDGKFRRAKNVVTSADGTLDYTMDDEGGGGLALEGMAQDGDSGGPAVVTKDDGVSYVAGANSGTSESNPCDYGSVDQYCRLSEHVDFIAGVVDGNLASLNPWFTYTCRLSGESSSSAQEGMFGSFLKSKENLWG